MRLSLCFLSWAGGQQEHSPPPFLFTGAGPPAGCWGDRCPSTAWPPHRLPSQWPGKGAGTGELKLLMEGGLYVCLCGFFRAPPISFSSQESHKSLQTMLSAQRVPYPKTFENLGPDWKALVRFHCMRTSERGAVTWLS